MTFIIAICLLLHSHNIPFTHILSHGLIWHDTKMKQGLRYVNISPTMQLFPWCNSFGINIVCYSYYTMTVVRLLILLSTAKASTHVPPKPISIQTLLEVYTLYFTSPFDTLHRKDSTDDWAQAWFLRADTETGELWEFHLHKTQAGGCVPVLFFSVMWGADGKPIEGWSVPVSCHLPHGMINKKKIQWTAGEETVKRFKIVQTPGVSSSFVYLTGESWKSRLAAKQAEITIDPFCIINTQCEHFKGPVCNI